VNLGISVDGHHARAALLDANDVVVAGAESTEAGRNHAVLAAARETLAAASGSALSAVGISFPDPDPKSWPLDLSFLSDAVGWNGPVKALSTGNATALAEAWCGIGRGVGDLVAFSVGLSVSAGVISNGSLLRGAHGVASSIAWLALNPVERDDYRRLGCLEAEGGAAGIVRRLIWRIKSGDRSRVLDGVDGDFGRIHLDDIFQAARDGDGVSISVVRDTAKYLAMAVSNIAAVVDPDLIVLGGVLQSAGDLLLDPMRQECARRMPPAVQERARIALSTLGPDAPAIGAARFALTGTRLP
jgi:predicted NBD/HSP70 family sugar kinase